MTHEPTILVVDDEATIRLLIRAVLEDEGFRVLTARDGAEALDTLEAERPSLVVLDLRMPVMDGRTFFLRLRADPRPDVCSLPVLIFSAVGARRAQRELGAEGAIDKPVDPDQLVEEVGRLIVTAPAPEPSLRSTEPASA